MNPIQLALSCKDAISRGSIDMPLLLRGHWGKRNWRLFAGAGSPRGEIVKEIPAGLIVMFPCQELLDYTVGKLATVCKDLGCSGVSPTWCPGNPDCQILRALFRYEG